MISFGNLPTLKNQQISKKFEEKCLEKFLLIISSMFIIEAQRVNYCHFKHTCSRKGAMEKLIWKEQ